MAHYRIDVSEPAENDLRNIVRYISARLFAPLSPAYMMDAIEETIKSLVSMPQSSPNVSDERLSTMGYHKLSVKNHIVFFTIDEKSKVVNVERILYTKRIWHHIL